VKLADIGHRHYEFVTRRCRIESRSPRDRGIDLSNGLFGRGNQFGAT
jgi:hypothetical protein